MSPRTQFRTARRVLGPGLVVVLGTLSGCAEAITNPATAWEGVLQPVLPAVVHGSVAVLSETGRSEASILIRDGKPGASYRWRIRRGSCEIAGDIVGGRAQYPVLSPGPSGEAGADASLSRMLDRDGEYAGWVQLEFVAGQEEEVACGELVRLGS